MLILLFLSVVYGKSTKSHLVLTDADPWKSVTDFGLDVGSGNYTIRVRLSTPLKDRTSKLEIQLGLYLGVQWNEDLIGKTCEERVKQARKLINIELPGNTDWSAPIEGKLTQKSQPYVWHFVFSDCSRQLGTRKIRYELSVMNPGNSHFSVEMQGVKTIYGCLMIILLIGLLTNIYSLIKFSKDDEEIQAPAIWLNFSIVFQILGVVFFYFHLYIYEGDGEGISVFNFFGEAFTLISSLSITTLLIIIAGGWTIAYSDFPVPELYIPALFLLTFLHLFMAGFGYLHESDKSTFTRYEGTSGLVIIIMRAVMYCWFLFNLYSTSRNKDIKKYRFIYKFGVGASLYFLSLPLLVIGSSVFKAHQREKIIVAGANLTQAAAFYLLYLIFTGKGDYHKMNSVFSMLPGSKAHTR